MPTSAHNAKSESPAAKKAKATPGGMNPTPSWWGDWPVPDLGDLLTPRKIDPVEFEAWLGSQLGIYHGSLAVDALRPAPAEEVKAIQEVVARLEAARIALHDVPWRSRTRLIMLLQGEQIDAGNRLQRMERDLTTVVVLLTQIARGTAAGKRGRKPTIARDTLFLEVVGKLRKAGIPSDAKADEVAETILIRCGVLDASFSDADAMRRVRRRARYGPK